MKKQLKTRKSKKQDEVLFYINYERLNRGGYNYRNYNKAQKLAKEGLEVKGL